jgi:adenylosuccinate synthase
MPLDIIVGAQWGDEGKGRITDMLAAEAAVVARYSGGDNAGHTVTIGGDVFKLHLVPSGIIHAGVTCLLGNGVVINPQVLLAEMDRLAGRGVDVGPGRLKISQRAHLLTPAHVALDKANESRRGKEAIGTTGRGIGPAYADKTGRSGLRAELLAEPETLADAIHEHVRASNAILTRLYDVAPLDAGEIATHFAEYAYRLAPYLVDGSLLLDEALRQGRPVLAEGAQGTLLDLDHGTYPYVTSSSPTAGGALVGLGVGPRWVRRVVGVAKAFTTRVGGGPFPCELEGDAALRLRGSGANPWDEYGTTTGRPRRVGWLDTVILRYAVRVNGLTELALTKLDVLSGLAEIPVCVTYELAGKRLDHLPNSLADWAACRPVYDCLPGWNEDIRAITEAAGLPANARRYIDAIARAAGAPVSIVSVGPGRDQYIRL